MESLSVWSVDHSRSLGIFNLKVLWNVGLRIRLLAMPGIDRLIIKVFLTISDKGDTSFDVNAFAMRTGRFVFMQIRSFQRPKQQTSKLLLDTIQAKALLKSHIRTFKL